MSKFKAARDTRSPASPAHHGGRRSKIHAGKAPPKTRPAFLSGQSLGAPYNTLMEAAALVEAGLPFATMDHFLRTTGLTLERTKQVARISEGSFDRRKRAGRWSRDESERLLRLGRVFERAASLYDGDVAGAREWLETPLPVLGGRRPLDLARTEPGAREVEDLIGRIEYGVVS